MHENQIAEKRLPVNLRRLWYKLDRLFQNRLGAVEYLTTDQYSVLRCIHEKTNEVFTQTDISKLLGLHPNTITQICSKLEEKGLLTRFKVESDQRLKNINLTKQGYDTLVKHQPQAIALQKLVINGLPKDDQSRFLDQLQLLAEETDKLK